MGKGLYNWYIWGSSRNERKKVGFWAEKGSCVVNAYLPYWTMCVYYAFIKEIVLGSLN